MAGRDVSVANARFKLFGYDHDPYYRSIEAHLQHGPLISVLAHLVPSGASIIDVGANIGGTVALMHRFVKNPSIVCFEPSKMFSCLEATVAANGFEKTRCVNACVGKLDGTTSFVDCGDYAGHTGSSAAHSHIGDAGTSSRQVPVKMLDTFARDMQIETVDFVKIDVEGFEEDVLDGMTFINAHHRPLIFMEFDAFCISVYAKKSPYILLERICNEFGGFVATRNGAPHNVETAGDLAAFLFSHMTENHCVEDIIFSAAPGLRAKFAL